MDRPTKSTTSRIRKFHPGGLRSHDHLGKTLTYLVRPNRFIKRTRQRDRQIDESIRDIRSQFWPLFTEAFEEQVDVASVPRRYGGGQGHLWLLPSIEGPNARYEPHVLVYITAPAGGSQRLGLCMAARKDAPESIEALCAQARDHALPTLQGLLPDAEAKGDCVLVDADLSTADSMHAAAGRLAPAAAAALRSLRVTFSG